MKLQHPLVILSAWLLVACQGEAVPSVASGGTTGGAHPDPTGTVTAPTPTTQDYILDFSKGTFTIGYRRGYWLGFDFNEPTQGFTGPASPGQNGLISANVATRQTVGSYCGSPQSELPEVENSIKPGDVGWVDHVDVDMTPLKGTPVPSTMCFGNRDPDGTWRWKLAPQKPIWDEAHERFRMTFQVQHGPAVGFAILTDDGPFLHLEKITIAAKKESP